MSASTAIDYERGVEDAWTSVANFVPKLVAFVVILVIGYIIAKVLAKATNAILERVGFDNAVERGGVKQALSKSKYDASDLVAKLVYYAVLLITLVTAFNVFGTNAISTLLAGVVAFLPKLVIAILIVVVASAIAAGVKDLISGTLGGLSYGKTLANIASVFILGLGIIAALNQIGVATTITTPILIAVLATIAGVIIVGAGGGLIRPMQNRWERWLLTAEQEAPRVKAEAAANGPAYAEQRRAQAQQAMDASASNKRGATRI